jgi:Insertion element 4 transposase N-terminal
VTSAVAEERPWGRLTDHIGLGVVSDRFGCDLLEEVLNRTQRREKRSRRLPAHVMIRYVVAMGLFAAESYDEVMRRLVGNLRKLGSWEDGWQVPTKSAITQARQRLGPEPMKALFDRAAVPLATSGTKGAWPARRRLMAIDATSFDVADTAANVERFGRMGSGPKASTYPKLHVAALAECGSHAVVGAVLGGCRTGERTPGGRPDQHGRPGHAGHGRRRPVLLRPVRRVRDDRRGSGLADRRDLRGRGEVLRSQSPDLVEQQLWGLLLAHYAIRALLLDAADPAGYDPDRMSFIKGLRVVRRQVTDRAAITS